MSAPIHNVKRSTRLEHAPLVRATCVGCGCDDLHACRVTDEFTHQRGRCYWLDWLPVSRVGVCSACPGELARFRRFNYKLTAKARARRKQIKDGA